jgi:hypothetical protein
MISLHFTLNKLEAANQLWRSNSKESATNDAQAERFTNRWRRLFSLPSRKTSCAAAINVTAAPQGAFVM